MPRRARRVVDASFAASSDDASSDVDVSDEGDQPLRSERRIEYVEPGSFGTADPSVRASILPDDRAATQEEVSSASSSDGSTEASVDERDGDASEMAVKSLPYLDCLLSHILPNETLAECVRRLTAEKMSTKCSLLVSAGQSLVELGDPGVFMRTREHLLELAVKASKLLGKPITPAFALRWVGGPSSALHGPFDAERMKQWQANLYFVKKAAEVLPLHVPGASWCSAQPYKF